MRGYHRLDRDIKIVHTYFTVSVFIVLFVCFITKSFLTYSFVLPTPTLSTICRPLSSYMCSITPETVNVGSSYSLVSQEDDINALCTCFPVYSWMLILMSTFMSSKFWYNGKLTQQAHDYMTYVSELELIAFNHILQHYFTGTSPIIR